MEENKNNLGQVFTDSNVAKYMIELFSSKLNNKTTILDPCIGGNIFFNELKRYNYKKLIGVEVDKELITNSTKVFFDNPKHKLFIKNFFDFNNGKFDFIIMNPPYVRHELLKNNEVNSKENIFSKISDDIADIPKKTNLYIYFIIKALSHLRKNGELIAIIYDSWLYTDFGKYFKTYITNNFCIKEIIHLKNGAFHKINVGATILVVKNKIQTEVIEYKQFDNAKSISSSVPIYKLKINEIIDFYERGKQIIDFENKIFTSINKISERKIDRGINAKINKYFILKENRFPGNTKNIIKKINKISLFSVNKSDDYILITDSKIKTDLSYYLEKVQKEILKSKTHNLLKEQIKNSPKSWHQIKVKESGTIIFNYYFRDHMDFIANKNSLLVSDNFYNLHVAKDYDANFAILNSTITKISIIKYSKSQGNGLFKIQLNNFRLIKIIDVDKISNEIKKELTRLGLELQNCKRNNKIIIEKIDKILHDILSKNKSTHATHKEIQEFLASKVND